MTQDSDHHFMALAIEQAKIGADWDEVPVGAVLVQNNEILAKSYNQPIGTSDPTAHAEVRVLREAGRRINNYRLPGTTLYVTLEPCTMCFGAMLHARVDRLVYGATEPRAGVIEGSNSLVNQTHYNHHIQVTGGIMADTCSVLLTDFFRKKRQGKG